MGAEEMIAEGMYLVQNDPQHDLNLGFRCRLISSFDEAGADIGRRRRVKLGKRRCGKSCRFGSHFFQSIGRRVELWNLLTIF